MGPYIGPRGGKWADPQHTVSWQDKPEHHRSINGKEGMVTAGGKRLYAESPDTEDSMPPAIASFQTTDGWLVYTGRNGSEGVVVGSAPQLVKWKADVRRDLRLSPIAKPAVPWTPRDGGSSRIALAEKTAELTAQAFGQPKVRISFFTDGRSGAGGEASHLGTSVTNAHTKAHTEYTGVFEGVTAPQGAHMAAHETAHVMYGVNPQAGKAAEAAVAAHTKAHGALTLYHAVSNHHEGLMEAVGIYMLNSKAMTQRGTT